MGLFAVLLPLQILFRLLAEHVGHIAAEDHVDLAAHGEVGDSYLRSLLYHPNFTTEFRKGAQ